MAHLVLLGIDQSWVLYRAPLLTTLYRTPVFASSEVRLELAPIGCPTSGSWRIGWNITPDYRPQFRLQVRLLPQLPTANWRKLLVSGRKRTRDRSSG